jgi:hypothetical protein
MVHRGPDLQIVQKGPSAFPLAQWDTWLWQDGSQLFYNRKLAPGVIRRTTCNDIFFLRFQRQWEADP